MSDRIGKLNDELAVYSLKKVVRKWFENKGFEAYCVVSSAQLKSGIFLHNLPDELTTDEAVNSELGDMSRYALKSIVDGDNDEITSWVNEVLDEVEKPKAQAFDPLTWGVIGLVVIGLVLASRIKSIGSAVEFYEGVPKEVVDIVKAGSSVNIEKG